MNEIWTNIVRWFNDPFGIKRRERHAREQQRQEQEAASEIPVPPPVTTIPEQPPVIPPVEVTDEAKALGRVTVNRMRFMCDGKLFVPTFWTEWQLPLNCSDSQMVKLAAALGGNHWNTIMFGDDGKGWDEIGNMQKWYVEKVRLIQSVMSAKGVRIMFCYAPVRYDKQGKPYCYLKPIAAMQVGKTVGRMLSNLDPKRVFGFMVGGLDDRKNGVSVVPSSMLNNIADGYNSVCGLPFTAHPACHDVFVPPVAWGKQRFATMQSGHTQGTFTESYITGLWKRFGGATMPRVNIEPCYEGMVVANGYKINGSDVSTVQKACVKLGAAGLGYGNYLSWPCLAGHVESVGWAGAQATIKIAKSIV